MTVLSWQPCALRCCFTYIFDNVPSSSIMCMYEGRVKDLVPLFPPTPYCSRMYFHLKGTNRVTDTAVSCDSMDWSRRSLSAFV